jgi:hypothetical protein
MRQSEYWIGERVLIICDTGSPTPATRGAGSPMTTRWTLSVNRPC